MHKMSRPPDLHRAVDEPDGLCSSRDGGHAYRLDEILQLKKQLEIKRAKRTVLYQKYHRGIIVMENVGTGLLTVSMGMSVTGVGLLSTIIAVPAVIALESAAAVCAALGVTGRFIKRRLVIKAKKHHKIRDLVNNQLNLVAGLMSTALNDGVISDEEFHQIVSEVDIINKKIEVVRAGAEKAHAEVSPPTLGPVSASLIPAPVK